MALEIALASFVKNEIVGAGIIAVIRQDEVSQVTICNCVQQPLFHRAVIRALAAVCEAFISAFPAGMNLKIRKLKQHSILRQGPDQFSDLCTVTVSP